MCLADYLPMGTCALLSVYRWVTVFFARYMCFADFFNAYMCFSDWFIAGYMCHAAY